MAKNEIECIKQIFGKILILDQVVLIAAEKTISGCSCGCHNNQDGDSASKPAVSFKDTDLKEFLEMHLKDIQINKSK